MTKFRPCIDLHDGRVKQIVGSTLNDSGSAPRENFVSDRPASWFAEQYQKDNLTGGHVIMLGKGNDVAAGEALAAYPGGLQVGGGINAENAASWLQRGASHVIVTSSVFDASGHFQVSKLDALVKEVGADRLVLDLSCKATEKGWRVAMNRWQTLTDLEVTEASLDELAGYCSEFLIHAVDVEGKCEGIDQELARFLGHWGKRPLTYAGGISRLGDLWTIQNLSGGKMDATIGSALDMFGGNKVRYADCVKFNSSGDAKSRLRTVMRAQLNAMTEPQVQIQSQKLMSAMMRDERWVPGDGVVTLFGGMKGEPDLMGLMEWLVARNVKVAFMGFRDGELIPKLIASETDLVRGPFGVLMPADTCQEVPASSVAVVLTPGLSFSSSDGMRLGRGKGHYDRFFERAPEAMRVGVCWQDQLQASVPAEAHDKPMHRLITEQGWAMR